MEERKVEIRRMIRSMAVQKTRHETEEEKKEL